MYCLLYLSLEFLFPFLDCVLANTFDSIYKTISRKNRNAPQWNIPTLASQKKFISPIATKRSSWFISPNFLKMLLTVKSRQFVWISYLKLIVSLRQVAPLGFRLPPYASWRKLPLIAQSTPAQAALPVLTGLRHPR